MSCFKSTINRQASQILKVAIINGDDRMTIPEYAAKHRISKKIAELKFSATGILNCSGFKSTAQLTGRNDLITTAAHVFFDDECKPLPLSSCKFETQYGPSRSISIKAATAHIEPCDHQNPGDDWAVVELEEKVDGAQPYLVPNSPVELHEGQKFLQPSAIADNFRRGNQYPKNVSECHARNLNYYVNTPLLTDCDVGHGSSGGAQLSETSQGLILQAIVNKTPGKDGAYNPDSVFTTSATVTDDFFLTLQQMVNSPGH